MKRRRIVETKRRLVASVLVTVSLALPLDGAAWAGVTSRADAPPPVPQPKTGARSYQDISAAVARETPGRILRIRLVRRGGKMVYVVRVLRPDGKRRDIILDSMTLATIEK